MTILLTIKRPKIESDPTSLGEFSLGIKFRNNLLVDQEVQELEIAESLLLLGKQRSKFADNNARKKKKLKLVCGSHYFPKDNPERPRGEDAYFVSEEAHTIGVADGVGKWASRGVDAGEYARELMTNAFFSADKIRRDHVNFEEKNNNNQNPRKRKRKAVDEGMDIIPAVDPNKVLGKAYAETKKKLALQGSSTACILSLDPERGVLHSANVGDSGYMVFRGGKRIFASPTMQHKFNCPYQLGNGQGGSRDDGPKSAMVFELPGVMQGDIIVMGTDGLLDNIHPEQIEELLEATADRKGNVYDDREYCQGLASTLAEIALENSMNVDFDSPFAREANKAGLEYSGGKVDDITVIVAQVVC